MIITCHAHLLFYSGITKSYRSHETKSLYEYNFSYQLPWSELLCYVKTNHNPGPLLEYQTFGQWCYFLCWYAVCKLKNGMSVHVTYLCEKWLHVPLKCQWTINYMALQYCVCVHVGLCVWVRARGYCHSEFQMREAFWASEEADFFKFFLNISWMLFKCMGTVAQATSCY
jgi:hypothetical protein